MQGKANCGPYQARAHPRFYSMQRLGVFLVPPGLPDVSPSQGYPPALNLPVPI